ncbi:MAG: winged helix-turn-helix domain-containing protein [Rubrivivax sp.]|nr:winged helix-turn-helix domain-containing protein [Rubrivivax sp.]
MSNRFFLGRFEVRPDERRVVAEGADVVLGGRAFDLLLCLIEHRERFVSKDELLERVWPGLVVEENNITVQVSALRKLLGAQAVVNVSGRGYKLGVAVTEGVSTVLPAPAMPGAPPQEASALTLPDQPSLAVLPFENLSGDPQQEYFIDGVVDDIITALSRVRTFFVIARSSSFTYKGRAVNVKQVGRELGVRYVLEGSFRRIDTHVRVVGQLVDAETGRHIWAGRIDADVQDIFDLQDRLTESVVGAIEPSLRRAEIERARAKPTTSLRAYDLCLRAMVHFTPLATRAGNEEGMGYLKQAIALDPGYSYAKSMCARMQGWRKSQSWADDAGIREGIRLAEEALQDHRDDPDTLANAAMSLSWLARRHDEALHAIERALVLNPNSAWVAHAAGWIRMYVGQAAAAIAHFQRAIRLSPLDPLTSAFMTGLAAAYRRVGRFDDALSAGLRSLREAPDNHTTHRVVISCLVELGRLDEARVAAQRLLALSPGLTVSKCRALQVWSEPEYIDRYLATLGLAGIPE